MSIAFRQNTTKNVLIVQQANKAVIQIGNKLTRSGIVLAIK